MKYNFLLPLILLIVILSSFTCITDEQILSQGIDRKQLEQLKADKMEGCTGTVYFDECNASVTVPNGYVFLDKTKSKKLLVDYWNNPETHITNLLGCLVPNNCDAYYQVSMAYVISYDNCGYVEDDDANSVDYNELLNQIQQSSLEENKSLPKEQQCIVKGWAVSPKYLPTNHVLVWAKTLEIGGIETVNYDMRILGKDGLVSVNAVIDPADCSEVIASESSIINSIRYNDGYSYKDFDSSRDKTSEWTIGGLVAGGILAKSGFFAKLGILLLKFWKLGAVAVAGIGAAIIKFFKKNKDE